MPRKKTPRTLSGQLRELLDAQVRRGRSLYDLQQDSGVDRAVISRFLHSKRTITMETADKLAEALNCRIVGR